MKVQRTSAQAHFGYNNKIVSRAELHRNGMCDTALVYISSKKGNGFGGNWWDGLIPKQFSSKFPVLFMKRGWWGGVGVQTNHYSWAEGSIFWFLHDCNCYCQYSILYSMEWQPDEIDWVEIKILSARLRLYEIAIIRTWGAQFVAPQCCLGLPYTSVGILHGVNLAIYCILPY